MPAGKDCAVSVTVAVIGGRWKVLILQSLFHGAMRFSELQRELPEVTQKMLTQQLKELESHGIVHRQVFPERPPRVEYSLTDLGKSLWPVLTAMHDWGVTQMTLNKPHDEATDKTGNVA